MTLEEIKKSLVTDYKRDLKTKLKYIELSRHRKWMENGQQDFKETVVHTSRSNNEWRIAVQCKDGHADMIPYLVSYNHIGVTASHFTDPFATDAMLHFNTHFFKRYRERAQIDIEKPERLVKHFFKVNTAMIPCYYPKPDGSFQLFCPLDGGIGLGIFHEDLQVCEFKTFVDNSLLGEDQKQEVLDIYQTTLAEIEEECKRRLKKLGVKQ